MKKIIAVCLSLCVVVSAAFAQQGHKTYVVGLGEAAYLDSSSDGKKIIPATVLTLERWTDLGANVGIWLNGSIGFPKTEYYLPAGQSAYVKYFLDKGFLTTISGGLALNVDMGRYTLNFGLGPHITGHFMEIINDYSTNVGEYSLTAGISATVESRVKLGPVFFLTAGFPVSVDIFQLSNSNVSDYRRITVAPFIGVGLSL